MRLPVLIFAAGKSTRFGKNKLLYQIDKKPLILKTVEKYLGFPELNPLIVVLGYQALEVKKILSPIKKKVEFVLNPNYKDGKASSIRVGIKSLPKASKAVLIAQGDMPFIKRATIKKLLDAFRKYCRPVRARLGSVPSVANRFQNAEYGIILPAYKGIIGHPKIFSRRYFAALLKIRSDRTGFSVIKKNLKNVLKIPVKDPGVIKDFDYPYEEFSPTGWNELTNPLTSFIKGESKEDFHS